MGAPTLASRRAREFGDVQLGVRRTVLREGSGRPDVIVGVSAGLPAGQSPRTAGAGMVLVKSIDPVVLFANVNYRRAISHRHAQPYDGR
jgi:hypothetical protein